MKNKLLAASLLSMLASSTFAVEDTDKQTVKVIVPEVALLQVGDDPIEITMPAPTDAGAGFLETDKQTDSSTDLKISSNIVAGGTDKRKLTASITEALPENWKLSIDAGGLVGTAGTDIAIEGTDTTADILTGIANDKGTGTITYTFGPTSDGAMMAYSGGASDAAKSIEITYTLSAEGA